MRCLLFAVLLFSCGHTLADDAIVVCYNFGCNGQTRVVFSEEQLEQIAGMLALAGGPVTERVQLSQAIGQLYRWAAEQSPIGNDRAGNLADADLVGRMDCIDHSTTTERLLHMLAARGLLRWHRVLTIQHRVRGVIFEHYAAAIEEVGAAQAGAPLRYVVDTWYVDNGQPAPIMPLPEWQEGEGPHVE
jgi:hypothetical protein